MRGTFAALDVETANPDFASICQVGVVTFTDGQITGSWQSLVDPEDDFDPVNVSIHGINATSVAGAPRFVDVFSDLSRLLTPHVVATHTAFDRVAMSRAQEKYGLEHLACEWLDTARVCRRAWPQFARRGYGLAPVAKNFGIEFRHHDALEDARTAGRILVRAMTETGLGINDWVVRVRQPLGPLATAQSANPEGELFGEVIVFTGALSIVRNEACEIAARAGCDVRDSVGKTTTILVVGDSDIRKLAGQDRSAKHRKAESLIMGGQPIRILAERDFLALVHLDPVEDTHG